MMTDDWWIYILLTVFAVSLVRLGWWLHKKFEDFWRL
jgi:hypothetical protein